MNIFLVGMMGSGKSTVGRSLAKLLNYKFIDTDIEIEKKYSKSVSDIFNEFGESDFRDKEHLVLQKLLKNTQQVIATGGGLPCFFDHMEVMIKNGICIYLKAEPAFLASRLRNHKIERPLISSFNNKELDDYLKNLLNKRTPFYKQAHLHIEAKNLKVKDLLELIKKT